MSTLDGAVPLGLGITKLRLWDELHRVHCEPMHCTRTIPPSAARIESSPHVDSVATQGHPASEQWLGSVHSSRHSHIPCRRAFERRSPQAKRRRTEDSQTQHRSDDPSRVDLPHRKSQEADTFGVLLPRPPTKPGPSRQKPPPLVSRIKAKARRAKRKQQKAEHRRRLFLSHVVQLTRLTRQHHPSRLPPSKPFDNVLLDMDTPPHTAPQAVSPFPECLGVDLASFVDVVFDTDVQSSEITDPSDIEDEELAKATRMEIELRKKDAGEDVKVPSGVFRWMVARDFAERWPEKVRQVKANPWSGLEDVWGSPSEGRGESNAKRGEEPVRWQSGPRSRFIRRRKKATAAEIAGCDQPVNGLTETQEASSSSANDRKARAPTSVGLARSPETSTLAAVTAVKSSDGNSQPKRRFNSVGSLPVTGDPCFGNWDWSGANACSQEATLPSTTVSVHIRL